MTVPATIAIGVDIDGVLCDHIRGLCEWILRRYRIVLTPEMVTDWDFNFGPSSIAAEIRLAYADDDFLLSLPPVQGAGEAIHALAEIDKVRLTAVTSRPLETRETTIRWLGTHFPTLSVTYACCKESLPLAVLIDDLPQFVDRFAQKGRTGILFSRPWNLSDQRGLRLTTGVTIVQNWAEAVDTVKSLVNSPMNCPR